jgi:hypothetical protein
MISDILSIITDKTGITFKPVQSKAWSGAVKLAKTNRVDMCSAAAITEERAKYLNTSLIHIKMTPYFVQQY